MDKTTRQYADRLANILSKETALPSSVRELLNAVEQDGSLEAKQVINHPQQRHGGRTAVHIAANNGLWECLELLLKNGGGWSGGREGRKEGGESGGPSFCGLCMLLNCFAFLTLNLRRPKCYLFRERPVPGT